MKFELFGLVVCALIVVCVGTQIALEEWQQGPSGGDQVDSSEDSSDVSEEKEPATDNANDDDDQLNPSMLGMFGTKIAMADALYEEEYYDDDGAAAVLEEDAPPSPCCFPDVWQGSVKAEYGFAPVKYSSDDDDDNSSSKESKKRRKKRDVRRGGGGGRGGRPSTAHVSCQVFVDGRNKRIANNVVKCGDGDAANRWSNVSYIFKVGANKTGDLYLFNRAAKTCRHRVMSNVIWRRQCIPKNATSGGKFSLGPATGGLSVQSWKSRGCFGRTDATVAFDDDDSESNGPTTTTYGPRPRPPPRSPRLCLATNVLVAPKSCVPIMIQEEGMVSVRSRLDDDDENNENNEISWRIKSKPKPKMSRAVAFVGSTYFADVKAAISDQSVFNVPAYCSKTPNTVYYDEMEDEFPAILERFIVL